MRGKQTQDKHMRLSRLWDILRYLFLALGGSLMACLVAFFVILWRGPIDLTFLKPNLEKALSFYIQDAHLSVGHMNLKWDGIEHPLVIEVENVRVTSAAPAEAVQEFVLPKGRLRFRFSQFFMLQAFPRDTFLENPKVRYQLEGQDFQSADPSVQNTLSRVFKLLRKIVSFKRLEIQNGQLTLMQGNQEVLYDMQGMLKRKKNRLIADANIQGAHGKAVVKLDGNLHHKTLNFDIQVPNLSGTLMTFVDQRMGLKDYDLEKVNAHFKGAYHLQEGLQSFELQGQVINLKMKTSAGFPKDVVIPQIPFKANGTPEGLTAEISSMKVGQTPVHVLAKGERREGGLAMTIDVDTGQMALTELKNFWPAGLADDARTWIISNMQRGVVTGAQAQVHLHLPKWRHQWQFDGVKGKITLSEASLRYAETMPTIENLKAIANFTQKGFEIEVLQGACQRLKLSNGKVRIADLSAPVTNLSFDVDVQGALPDVLKFLDYKPLMYASQYKLHPQEARGAVTARLSMSFPLKLPFDTSCIETTCKASVSSAHVDQLMDLPVDLSHGGLDIKFAEGKLDVQGKALLNGSPATISYERFLDKQKNGIKDKAEIDMSLDPKSLDFLGFDLAQFVTYRAPTKLTYTCKYGKGPGVLSIESDLTPIELRAFHYIKPARQKASLTGALTLLDGKPSTIESLKIMSGGAVQVHGKGHFDPSGRLQEFRLEQVRFGQTEFSGHVRQMGAQYEAVLTAKTLDLQDLLNDERFQDAIEQADHDLPLNLSVSIDRLKLGGPRDFKHVSVRARYEKGLFKHLHACADIEGVAAPANKAHITINSQDQKMRKLKVKTNQAGAFFQAADMFETVQGGKLRFVGVWDGKARRPVWEGTAVIKDFAMQEAPALTHFLTLVFPTGVADLRKDNALGFQYMKLRFMMTPKKFTIKKGRAYGFSSGFSFEGYIERRPHGQLKINGSMLPAYFLNTLVSKIPLLGELISGGKHEGLFGVSFHMRGSKDDPETSVNPLSAFTPGFFRRFFTSMDDKDMLDDDQDESKDVVPEGDKDLNCDID